MDTTGTCGTTGAPTFTFALGADHILSDARRRSGEQDRRGALKQGKAVQQFFDLVNPSGQLSEDAVYSLLLKSKECKLGKSQVRNLRLLHLAVESDPRLQGLEGFTPAHFAVVNLKANRLTQEQKYRLLHTAATKQLTVVQLKKAVSRQVEKGKKLDYQSMLRRAMLACARKIGRIKAEMNGPTGVEAIAAGDKLLRAVRFIQDETGI